VFDAVKYRSKLRHVSRHAHLRHPGELGPFLFAGWKQRRYETELFERFRQAHYAKSAVLELPFSVADGLAARHGLDRSALIAGTSMTASERLRVRAEAERRGVEAPALDLARVPLTRLALYVLSLPIEQRREAQDSLHAALQQSARRALDRAPLRLGRVAAVLDVSASASGSSEKRRRPLAVALAAGYLLDAASEACTLHWTRPPEHPVLVQARGQTRLAAPLIDALRTGAELVVIVSDGFDNDPPDGVAEVCRVFRRLPAQRTAARRDAEIGAPGPPLDQRRQVELVHMNPVFDAEHYAPRTFGPDLPTVGLRDAEDLPTMLGFARFADGGAPLSELERYLEARIATWREAAT
jgi:hypothetical protein